MKNKIEKLVKKAKALKERDGLTENELRDAEQKLQIKLSDEFKEISQYYSYEYIGGFDFTSFPCGVIEYTLDYRKKGLPHRYIMLAYQGSAGVIFIETQDDRKKPSPVIWCGLEDLYNLCEGYGLRCDYDEWPSFTDFFEFLIEKEKEFQKQMKD